MAVSLSFRVFGEDQIDRELAGIEHAAADMRPAFEELRRRFLTIERRQFATQGGYSGGWAPLSPRYRAWKAQHYPGKTILRRTDALWRSLTEGPAVAVLEPSYMVLGSDVAYGRFHQQGGGRLPRRRPVEIADAERREWVKVIQSFIRTGGVTGVRAVGRPG
jgi:phage gpG-like protein